MPDCGRCNLDELEHRSQVQQIATSLFYRCSSNKPWTCITKEIEMYKRHALGDKKQDHVWLQLLQPS